MGTTLEGKQINETYQGLLKTTDNNEVGASAKEITDGKGNGTGVTLDNNGNVTATNVTATSFIGDGSQLTNLPVTSVNTQTGSVVLDADDISDTTTTNKFTTQADISKLAGIEDNADVTDVVNVTTSLNNISVTAHNDITSAGSGSIITSVERNKLDSIEDNAQVNPTNAEIKAAYESNTNTNAFTDALKSKLQNIEAGAEVNNINSVNGQVGTISLGLLNLTDVGADGSSGEVLTTDGLGNFTFQAAGGGEGLVTRVNGATGNVVLDTDDIDEGTTNKYYTEARVSANTSVAANTAKVGITTQQATDITTNNSKVGITTEQADAIVTNTAKNSYPSADSTKVGFISITQAVDLDTIESDVATNNAKVGITTQQAADIVTNNSKVSMVLGTTAGTALEGNTPLLQLGITSTTALAGNTTTITAQQASDITTNNAKISFDSASSTKLSGIEAGAEVNPTASEIKTSYESNADTNAFTDAEKTKLSGIATGATNVTDNSQIANGAGYITDGNTGWDNTYGFITATSTDTLSNKSGNISQWTNDSGYTTNVGTVTEVTVGTALGVTNGTTTPNITLDTANLYKVIGTATDYSSRVTLNSGVAEGATSVMKNLETLIFN